VAIAVLALSAGAALAGHSAPTTPAAAADGLKRASEAAGKTVPVAGPPAAAPDEKTDEDADVDAEAAQPAAPVDTQAAEHPDNHGKTVSEAATATTPDGFDNHGQYVKTIATDNHGQDVAADHVPADVSPGKPSR
jgi:hypothetical protein